ncbi:GNAT family N-acetyltransferase [Thermopolyspora sp. NPDC052614]|uniref:GNAT family N-acetyltransferase n=1 Tax=Thermopolyspora sp. NPDC052614 TaxID=3155682 RepID=UPI00342D8FD3
MERFSIERPCVSDAADIYALVSRHNLGVIGMADVTLDDIADQFAEPGFDPARDAWLLRERPGGRVAGWGWASRQGSGAQVGVEVVACDPDARALLWEAVLGRAREIGAESGHERVRVGIGIYRQDEAGREAARAHGFTSATAFRRLYIEHGGGPRPLFLPGVTLHRGADDEEALAAAHRVYEEAFATHYGHVARSLDEWAEYLESSAANDWSQLLLARVHGLPAGMILGSDQFVPDENCGYVRNLAVLPRFRGRGLGRLLLSRAFAEDERRGRRGTYLHVDAGNNTSALGLYLSVGMREVLTIDAWEATVEAARVGQRVGQGV